MIKQVFKTMVAFLAVATMTIGPVRGQNATTYTVAGNNAAMFGSAWDASYTANDMTMNGDGTYSITYTNVYLDDDVQYKVVKDHSWNEAYPDGNRVITIAEAGTYTLTIHFNPTTHEVYETMPTPHTVRFASGNDGWTVTDVDSARSATAPAVLQNVMAGDSLVVTAPASLNRKVKSVKAVKYVPPVLVQSIVLNKQTASLAKDSTMTLSVASVLPENAADKSYSWSSDDIAVADVDQNGVVTGHNAGTANIIATANDGSGAKDTCVVTVLSPAILDGVTVLYVSNDDNWSTVMGYNPGLMYQDDDNVRLTSNGAFLYYDGHPVFVDDLFYPVFLLNTYQWLLVTNINGGDFYYRQGETWQEAISANRMYNQHWSINDGKVIFSGDFILVDTNSEPVDPTATIDPSTVDYDLSPFNY